MRINNVTTIVVATCAVMLGGCASTASDTDTNVATKTSGSTVELQAARSRVAQLEGQLATRDQQLASSKMQQGASTSNAAATSLFPPNPKVGQCYARVLIPATYRTSNEQVLKSEASERFEIIPARYASGEERVLVKEASSRLEVIPAQYTTVEEQLLVKAASTRIVEIPAEYETVTERVLDEPAHTAWKKGPAAIQGSNVLSQKTSDTGEIMCLVDVPATYKTVTKRVLRRPASTNVVDIPAEYKTVSKRVVKKPATTREVVIPAQYETIKVTKLVSPAKEQRIAIPAEYGVLTRTEKATAESMEWRQVVCDVNLTRANVVELQKALADKGYYKAGIDGIIGSQTLGAAQKYALANNLPSGSNYIAVAVVKSLGLSI